MNPLAQLAGERVQHRAPRSGNGHRGTLGVQRLRDRPSNAAGRAGDKRRPAGQVEHHGFPATAWGECAAAIASFAVAISPGPPTEIPMAPSAMRLTRPLSTLPAPISKNRVTPRLAM